MQSYKRYCKTLTLKNDHELIGRYIAAHDKGQVWPEVTKGMKDVGIVDMEIYILRNSLFMIMDTVADFDHDNNLAELAKKPRQSEWEEYVSQFQNASECASADEKWQLLERIYKLD